MSKRLNIADRFGNEVIIYAGLAVTRITAYRLDQEFYGNTASCSDYVAFGPMARRVDLEPFTFEAAMEELQQREANCTFSGD